MTFAPPLVAHVVYRFGIGGLENGLVNLINGMPAQRWRHAVISLTDISEEFTRRIARTDVHYIALGKKAGHLVRFYPRLYRLLRGLGPSVVHTRNLAALEAVVPAWAAKVPVRIHGEHGWDMQDPLGRKLRYRYVRRLYRPFVNRYVALSRHLEEYLGRQVGVGSTSIEQIYNGVDTARFHPASEERRGIPGCPFGEAGEWLVGTVGRMETVKDPLNLARAFVRALELGRAAGKQLRLVYVGDGALRAQVSAYLERAGARERVWFAGERDDVPDIMRGLDCFVLPSIAEGISNTILEAMASRLPVIATRVGGNSELIEPGMTGLLVPAANSEALARAILDYLGDPAAAQRHAKAARRVVESRFSIARMIADYVGMYERALADAGVPVPRDGSDVGERSVGPMPVRH